MKRIAFLAVISLLAVGAVSSQNRDNRREAPKSLTVNGTLQLQKGVIAVADGSTVYLVPMLMRYIGFIEGLKEGASISIEGYAFGNYLQPAKATINGKLYDFGKNDKAPVFGPGKGPGNGPMRGFGPMRGPMQGPMRGPMQGPMRGNSQGGNWRRR